jgi:ribonuclease E
MAEPTPAAATAAPLPDPETLTRAEEFVREPFVLPGEDPAEALAPGGARRRALDAALAEIAAGAKHPSTHWRREYSLMLGLERVLNEEEPKLADGAQLNPHQVDALSGTLTALLAEAQRGAANGNGGAAANGGPAVAAAGGNGTAVPSTLVGPDDEAVPAEIDEEVPEDEEPLDWDAEKEADDEQLPEAPEDPNAHKRFWFEHATGAGKTVAAMGFVEASRTGGILILTHRRNLVDQFNGELKQRGYGHRARPAMLGDQDDPNGPVTVETYQWFVRNAGSISSAYTVVICDEAHTALGEKTAAAIRNWTGPMFIGMTATGALIARHVTDLFPTQTSRFDLAQAARRGVISPLRCVRIPPGPGVRTIAKVPLRRGEVDTEFDQEMLAELLDQLPFNLAAANLYKTRFNGMPGVVYAAGVRHAYNLAEAFREEGIKAEGVSGETPKRQLAEILAKYERGEIDVLINAQLLAEGWNSPRATVCFHLAPTASRRIYQQRVGRVTRRHPGKEAGIVVDFVHPGTKHDDPVVTLHSLLDRDVYRGGAIVVGPVRRGRGRRVRVERRVLPVASDENRRIEVFERELWRIAVEHLDWGEQIQWAALAGARVAPSGWRRARAMLHFDRGGELKRAFLLTAVQRNKNPQLRLRAIQEIAAARDPEAFDSALDEVGGWPRDEKREAAKVMLQALAEKRIGRRDQADAWIWRVAAYTAELHEEYAVQRWPETKRLLGLLANSSGGGHARNARRVVHAARKQDRRLAAALLAAATRYTHTPEAEEILRGARTRMARKPSSLSRELLRNLPKGRRGRGRRRKKKGGEDAAGTSAGATGAALAAADALDDDLDELPETDSDDLDDDVGEQEAEQDDEAVGADHDEDPLDPPEIGDDAENVVTDKPKRRRSRNRRRKPKPANADPDRDAAPEGDDADAPGTGDHDAPRGDADVPGTGDPDLSAERATLEAGAPDDATPSEIRGEAAAERVAAAAGEVAPKPKRRAPRRKPAPKPTAEEAAAAVEAAASAVLAARAAAPPEATPVEAATNGAESATAGDDAAPAVNGAESASVDDDAPAKPKRRTTRRKPAAKPAPDADPLESVPGDAADDDGGGEQAA